MKVLFTNGNCYHFNDSLILGIIDGTILSTAQKSFDLKGHVSMKSMPKLIR